VVTSWFSNFAYAGRRIATGGKHFALDAGAISVAFGLFITYQIGFVDGLFCAEAPLDSALSTGGVVTVTATTQQLN